MRIRFRFWPELDPKFQKNVKRIRILYEKETRHKQNFLLNLKEINIFNKINYILTYKITKTKLSKLKSLFSSKCLHTYWRRVGSGTGHIGSETSQFSPTNSWFRMRNTAQYMCCIGMYVYSIILFPKAGEYLAGSLTCARHGVAAQQHPGLLLLTRGQTKHKYT